MFRESQAWLRIGLLPRLQQGPGVTKASEKEIEGSQILSLFGEDGLFSKCARVTVGKYVILTILTQDFNVKIVVFEPGVC